jgi:hypothetical protein
LGTCLRYAFSWEAKEGVVARRAFDRAKTSQVDNSWRTSASGIRDHEWKTW